MNNIVLFPCTKEQEPSSLAKTLKRMHEDLVEQINNRLGPGRDNHVEKYSIVWKEEGRILAQFRESAGISQHAAAKILGIGQATLKKFEEGQPVQRANLLKSAYMLLLQNDGLRKRFSENSKGAINQ